jgi:hypothetical protein
MKSFSAWSRPPGSESLTKEIFPGLTPYVRWAKTPLHPPLPRLLSQAPPGGSSAGSPSASGTQHGLSSSGRRSSCGRKPSPSGRSPMSVSATLTKGCQTGTAPAIEGTAQIAAKISFKTLVLRPALSQKTHR